MTLPSLTVQLLTISLISLQRQSRHNEAVARNEWLESYDYIIIGGGSAGCVLASRLTEDPNVRVILLEAGGAQSIITEIPVEFNSNFGTEFNWGYHTVPQKKSGFAFNDRRIFYPRGRVLGGSSTINRMAFNRGNRRDYDSWGQTYGADHWSFESVLPYFIKLENNTDQNVVNANRLYHGTAGPLRVSSSLKPNPIFLRYIEATNRFGFPTIDLNGPTQLGTALIQHTVDVNGVRSSTANDYIESNEAYKRNNLHIIANAMVTKILTKKIGNTIQAYGVEFYRNNNYHIVFAEREVILSAGAINSPQILMLSGIGPRQHLQQFDIPVVIDLPVGDNLGDHLRVDFDYVVNNASKIVYDEQITLDSLYEYYAESSGPLANYPSVYTYLSTPLNDNHDWPDGLLCLIVQQTGYNLTETVSKYGSHANEWREYYRPLIDNEKWFQLLVGLFRTRSTGSVRLASSCPFDAPLIDPNYFSDDRDLTALVHVMKRGLQIADSRYFRRYATLYSQPIPGCGLCSSDVPIYDCDSYLRCVAQTITATFFHPVGTCRMGFVTDAKTVVDSKLRVKGVSKLRVIDASVMPVAPNANTNTATIMIAERGADFIRADRINQLKTHINAY